MIKNELQRKHYLHKDINQLIGIKNCSKNHSPTIRTNMALYSTDQAFPILFINTQKSNQLRNRTSVILFGFDTSSQ